MIFGFGKKSQADDDDDDDEEEVEFVLFQGALNGRNADMGANAKLAEAGLVPTKQVVSNALARRAEAIQIGPKGGQTVVAFYIDGIAYPGGRLSKQQGLAVTQLLKLLAGLDIKVRNKPQAGGIKATHEGVPYHLYVESTPAEEGAERIKLRAANQKKLLESAEDIGFSADMKQAIRNLAADHSGVLLAAGPPKSGTSTTAIGIVKSLDAYVYTIYNLADLGGRELSHLTNFEKSPGDDLNTTISRCMRVEADGMFLDPIRDAAAAKTVFENQKQVVLVSEITAPDAASGIVQLCGWVGAEQVAEGLKVIVSQKLIRLLCNSCKLAFRPNPKLLEKLGLPSNTKTLYRQFQVEAAQETAGETFEECPKCSALGYFGRTAIFEMIMMTDGMKQVVTSGSVNPQAIRAQAKKEKMSTLREEGMRLVGEGRTSIEELQRIFKG